MWHDNIDTNPARLILASKRNCVETKSGDIRHTYNIHTYDTHLGLNLFCRGKKSYQQKSNQVNCSPKMNQIGDLWYHGFALHQVSSPSEETHGICIQMYASESEGDSTGVTDNEERPTSKGKLCFGVELNNQQTRLKIQLKHALRYSTGLKYILGCFVVYYIFQQNRNIFNYSLRSKSMKGSIHPAIQVSMHPDSKKNKFFTRAYNSANPQINETFTFQLPQPVKQTVFHMGIQQFQSTPFNKTFTFQLPNWFITVYDSE